MPRPGTRDRSVTPPLSSALSEVVEHTSTFDDSKTFVDRRPTMDPVTIRERLDAASDPNFAVN